MENSYLPLDCIETAAEAKALLRLGILPTHVLHLITPFYPNLDELLYCNVPVNWPEYRQRITAIRNVFQTKFIARFLQSHHSNKHWFSLFIQEIHCSNRVLTEVVNECVSVTKIRPGPNLVKPRIVLLGPRGSGRKTQAKLLSESLKLVHSNGSLRRFTSDRSRINSFQSISKTFSVNYGFRNARWAKNCEIAIMKCAIIHNYWRKWSINEYWRMTVFGTDGF